LVISAWNYPIYTAIPQVAAAISAGNCVILKPSEVAPEISRVIKKLFDKYMDPGIYF
jgi:aldehyde dehydrogenase (NAD+)